MKQVRTDHMTWVASPSTLQIHAWNSLEPTECSCDAVVDSYGLLAVRTHKHTNTDINWRHRCVHDWKAHFKTLSKVSVSGKIMGFFLLRNCFFLCQWPICASDKYQKMALKKRRLCNNLTNTVVIQKRTQAANCLNCFALIKQKNIICLMCMYKQVGF